jgi:hypothetical protein
MTRRHLAALVAITFLAAFLRFYKLDVLPPGLFGDEALVTLHARTSVATGHYPIYFTQQDGGFHPAVVYLTILMRWLTNNHPYATRFGIAMCGVLSIPLAFFSLREIYRLDLDETFSAWTALIGSLILAITFPFVLITRLGFEVMLPAPLGALSLGFLAAGLRTRLFRYFAFSGLALGVSLYTYYSARLLPVAITLALIWLGLIAGRATWRDRFINWIAIAVSATLAFAPLGWYFLHNPTVFFARAAVTGEQTLGQGLAELPFRLLNSTGRTLASLSINGFGDFIPRHNIPWQAVFDPFLSVLFWIGLVIAVRQWRRSSSVLLVSWTGAMLLPVILTMTLNAPHFTRMMGALPALAGLAGLGALTVWQVVSTYSQRWAYSLVTLGLVFSACVTIFNYFVRWANDPALFDAFQVGGWRAANLALERTKTGRVLLSPEVLDDPSDAAFNVLLRDTSAQQFPGPDCLAYYDQPDMPVTFISSTLHDSRTFDRVHSLFPTGHEGATIIHEPDPWPLYQVFEVPAGAKAQPPSHLVSANFGDQIKLIGYDLDADRYRPGDTVHLTLYWRARVAPNGDYNAFVHLYASDNYSTAPVAQTDGAPCSGKYFTSRWQAGEIVLDERTLALPADGLTGSLPLAVGLYGWPSLERLPVTASDAILPDNRFLLTSLDIQP